MFHKFLKKLVYPAVYGTSLTLPGNPGMSTAFFLDSSTPLTATQLVIQGLQGQVSLRGEQGFPLLKGRAAVQGA